MDARKCLSICKLVNDRSTCAWNHQAEETCCRGNRKSNSVVFQFEESAYHYIRFNNPNFLILAFLSYLSNFCFNCYFRHFVFSKVLINCLHKSHKTRGVQLVNFVDEYKNVHIWKGGLQRRRSFL